MVTLSPFPIEAARDVGNEAGNTPLLAAIKGGFSGAGLVQEYMRNRANLTALQQQNALRQIDLSAYPQEVQNRLRSQAQTLTAADIQNAIGKIDLSAHHQEVQNRLRSEAQTLAAAGITNSHQAHSYAISRLAELKNVPDDQIKQNWGEFRKDLLDVGISPTDVPEKYGDNARSAIDHSARIMSEPTQQKIQIEEAKLFYSAQAKMQEQQLADQGSAFKSFGQKEGEKNSDYFDTISNNSVSAQKIYNDTLQMQGLGGQIPKSFGVVSGNKMYFTPKGQQVMQSIAKFVLDKYEGMKHIGQGSKQIIDVIRDSKGKNTISYDAFKNIVASYRALSIRDVEKNSYANYLKNLGVVDRNKIQNIWNMYEQKYPIFDNLGHANMNNLRQWDTFLAMNNNLLSIDMSHHIKNKTQVPQGFIFK